jgi:hypothetical protein
LDEYIFGAMKPMWRRLFDRHCNHCEDGCVTKSDAIKFVVKIWDLLEVHVIDKGWGFSQDADGDAFGDDEWDSEVRVNWISAVGI